MARRKLKREEVPKEWLEGKTEAEINDLLIDIPGFHISGSFEMTEAEEKKAHEWARRVILRDRGIDIGEWQDPDKESEEV